VVLLAARGGVTTDVFVGSRAAIAHAAVEPAGVVVMWVILSRVGLVFVIGGRLGGVSRPPDGSRARRKAFEEAGEDLGPGDLSFGRVVVALLAQPGAELGRGRSFRISVPSSASRS
jgi:hypothetical protein